MVHTQIIALIVNSIVLSLVVGGTAIYIWNLKLGSKNDALLFILFIVYWMAPLMCREYTGQMHIFMEGIEHTEFLMWLPLAVYGIAGLIFRPLTEVLSFKMHSRKNIIYVSLAIQFGTMFPMFFAQTLATNIIQSIGAGVGASIIGLFNVMFSEKEQGRKVFRTVSLMAIPPLIAEMFTGGIKSIVCSFLPRLDEMWDTPSSYLKVMRYLWLVSVICVLVSLALTMAIKEDRHVIFRDLKMKEAVSTASEGWVVALLAVVALCLGFARWIGAGPSTLTQFVYLGEISIAPQPNAGELPMWIPTQYMEGYISVLFALGELVGAILVSVFLKERRKHAKWVLVLIGCILYEIYFVLNTIPNVNFLNGIVYFVTSVIDGIAYGIIFPITIGIMLNKHFTKRKVITPVGIYNTCLAGGITVAAIFGNLLKGGPFVIVPGQPSWTFDSFVVANLIVNNTTMIVIAVMFLLFIISYIIHIKFPPKLVKVGIKFNAMGESEF